LSAMFWVVLALFVMTDIIIITVVIRRMGPAMQVLGFSGGANRSQLLKSAHTMVGDYLRANYSGDPGQLQAALSGLVPKLRDLLRSQGVEPQPEVVRALVEISAARHRIATLQQLREALANIA
jgi:hypothetical protein